MKWLGRKVNPLSIDSGSKEEINKSLSKYVSDVLMCFDHLQFVKLLYVKQWWCRRRSGNEARHAAIAD